MKQYRYIFIIIISLMFLLALGCSKSGRRANVAQPVNKKVIIAENTPLPKQDKTVVKMKKINGVFEIPVEINGVSMNFIFDTGAGLISISEKEVNLLTEQGKLAPDDIIGKGDFTDATGNVSENDIIRIKTVKIGNRVLNNVEASVVRNLKAPLLVGQSALEKFGKISIDYKNEEIIFE